MLAYLDTLIGFCVVMLIFSLLITILTQVVSAMFNHRGGNLLWGLKTLFAQFDPKGYQNLSDKADTLARQVLTHPMISDSWFSENKFARWLGKIPPLGSMFGRFQIASAVRIGELKDVLQSLASDTLAGQPVAKDIQKLLGTAQAAAVAAGVPGSVTTTVQQGVSAVRADVDRLEDWFGSIMDRTSQKFAMYMRLWTMAFAFAFAFGTGLNTPVLINDLYTNGAFRNALVTAAPQVNAVATSVQNAANVAGTASADDRKTIQDALQNATKLNQIASGAGLQVFRLFWPDHFREKSLITRTKYWLGVLMTWALLSLGAPFWFNALKSLTNLRPVPAAKTAAEAQPQAGS